MRIYECGGPVIHRCGGPGPYFFCVTLSAVSDAIRGCPSLQNISEQ